MKANEYPAHGDMRGSHPVMHLYAQLPEHYAHPQGLEISLTVPGYTHYHPATATYTAEGMPDGHAIELSNLDGTHFQAQPGGVPHQEYGIAIQPAQQHLHAPHPATIDYHGMIHAHGPDIMTTAGPPPPDPSGITHWAPMQQHLDPSVFITDQPLPGVLVDGMVCHQPIGIPGYHHPQSLHTGVDVHALEENSESSTSANARLYDVDKMDKRPLKPWTEEENQKLKAAVKRYGERSWRKIAEEVPGRSSVQCLQHWKHVLSPDVGKGAWTPEEDARLVRLVEEKGYKWAEIAKELPGRIGKRCRERYMNHLNPELRKVGSRSFSPLELMSGIQHLCSLFRFCFVFALRCVSLFVCLLFT